jgi:diguanylate cyclase (GGDEF)-like protein
MSCFFRLESSLFDFGLLSMNDSVQFSIKHKLAILLLSLIVIALMSVGRLYHVKASENLKRVIYSHIQSTGELTFPRVRQMLTSHSDRLHLIASRTKLRQSLHQFGFSSDSTLRDAMSKIIVDARDSVDDIKHIAVYDHRYNLVVHTQTHRNLRAQPDFTFEAATSDLNFRFDIIPDESNRPVIQVVGPLVYNDSLIGYVVVQSSIEPLLKTLQHYSGLGQSEEIVLVKLLNDKVVGINPTRDHREQYFYPIRINPFKTSHNQIVELVDRDQQEVYALTQNFHPTNLGLVIKVARDDVLGVIKDQESYLLLALAIALGLSALVVMIFSKRFTKPIIDMTAVATIIANGDLKKRIEHLSRDELGVLGRAFNLMADKLIEANDILEGEVKDKTEALQNTNRKLVDVNTKLQKLSSLDHLTQLLNRRAFEERCAIEWKRCRRERLNATCMIVDIDYFKRYNDRAGHQAGDECLANVTNVFRSVFQRETDLVARYGGEEFIAFSCNTEYEEMERLSEKLHTQLRQSGLEHPDSPISQYVTFSIGIATAYPSDELLTCDKLVYQADQALYQAKANGRNKTTYFRHVK